MHELRGHHRAYKEFARDETMGVLVRLLARPLAKQEAQRSEDTGLVLALAMNILYTAAPDAAPPKHSRMGEAMQDVAVLRKLLVAMEREHGLDLLVYITQQVEVAVAPAVEPDAARDLPVDPLGAGPPVSRRRPPSATPRPPRRPRSPRAAARAPPKPPRRRRRDSRCASRASWARCSSSSACAGLRSPRRRSDTRASPAVQGALRVRHANVVAQVTAQGEAVLPVAPKKRATKAKMPLTETVQARPSAEADALLLKLSKALLLGPFNTLMGTVVKDLGVRLRLDGGQRGQGHRQRPYALRVGGGVGARDAPAAGAEAPRGVARRAARRGAGRLPRRGRRPT